MRPDTWYGQAMASDKERLQAWLEKMNADEIREKLPHFRGKKKSAAIDELVARAQDEELKALSRKETTELIGALAVLALAVFSVIALFYLALL